MVSLSMRMQLCSVLGRNQAACEKAQVTIEKEGKKIAEALLTPPPAAAPSYRGQA